MSSIDERIVQMQFDNDQFESGVKTTLNTLDKLKSSLKLQNATKGFEDVNKSVKGIDLNPLINSVETVSNRFSTLGIIGTTALINITNKAIDAGEKLVKSLSIDQIAAGWSKYADKTAAVQTIMSATRETWEESAKALEFEGTQMEFVNEQLDRLNWFTDETSYNFLDMVNNIGKFTNNGVALQDAVESMEGISTWAALSGANVTDAGRAMYNFSQAMGAGAMKLQDWKSIENVNMATMEFKQTAIDTALELGKLKKAEDGMYEATKSIQKGGPTAFGLATFSQSLKDAWFDTEVMTKSLKKFGGFANELNDFLSTDGIDEYYYTTNRLLDDLDKFSAADAAGQMEILQKASQGTGKTVDELREEFEKLNSDEFALGKRAFKAAQEAKTFAEAIDSVKDAVSTGWMNTFELIFGNYEEAKVLWTDLANSLYDIFAEGGNVRNDLLQVWRDLDGRKALIEGFANLFSSLLRMAEPLSNAFHEVFHTGADFVNEMGWKLTVATARFRDFASNLWLTDTAYENLTNTFKGLFTVIKGVLNVFKTIASILSVFLQPLNVLADVIFSITGRIGQMIMGAEEAAKKSESLAGFIENIRQKAQLLADILTIVIKVIGLLVWSFLDWIETSDIAQRVLDNLRGGLYILAGAFKMAIVLVAKFIVKVVEIAEKVVPRVKQAFTDLWNNLVEAFPGLETVRSKITSFFKSISKIKGSSEVFDKLRSKIKLLGTKVNPILDNVGKHIWNLLRTIKNFTVANTPKAFQLLGDAITGLGKVVTSIGAGMGPVFEKLGQAFGIFIDKIKSLDWDGIAANMQAKASVIAGVLVSVGSAIWHFIDDFVKAPNKIEFIVDKIKKIIDDINKKLQEIAKDKNIQELGQKIQNFVDKINEAFKGLNPAKFLLFAFGAAMVMTVWKIGTAFEKIGQFAETAKDLFGITSLIEKLKNAIKATTTITQIALSISMIAAALKVISEIPKEDLMRAVKVIGGVAIALAAISFALSKFNAEKFTANTKSIIYIAGAIGILAAALWILSKTANIDGLLVKAGALALIIVAFGAVAIALNRFAPEFKASSKGLMALAASVLMLTKALDNISKTLEKDNAEQAVETLIGLMATLGVLAVAASGVGFGVGFGMMGLVASIMMLDLALKYLLHFGTTADQIMANIDKVITVLGILAVILMSTRLAGEHAAQAGVAALLISTSLILLTYAIDQLKGLDAMEIGPGVVALGVLALALGGALKLIGDAGKHAIKAGIGALLITAAVMLLTECVKSFYELLSATDGQKFEDKLNNLAWAIIGIVAILGAIALAVKASEKAKVGPLLAMILTLGAIVGSIAMLSVVASADYVAYGAAIGGICLSLIALAVAVAAASKLSEKAKLGPLIAMVAGLGVLIAGLTVLTFRDSGKVLLSAAALGGVMLALGKAAQWANKAEKGVKALAVMAVPLLAAAGSIFLLSTFANVDGLIPAMVALVGVMLTIAGAAKWANDAEKGAEALKKMALPLAVAAGALWLVTKNNADWKTIAAAAAAMAGIMLALAKAAQWAKGAEASVKSMAAMSIPLGVAAAGLYFLGDPSRNWANILAGAVALGGVMVAIAYAAQVAKGAEGGAGTLIGAAFALIEVAAAMDMFALAAVGFAWAADTVVNAFIKLGSMSEEQVNRATEAIKRFGFALGEGLGNVITGLGTSLIDGLDILWQKIEGKLDEWLTPIYNKALELAISAADGFFGGRDDFVGKVYDLIKEGADTIENSDDFATAAGKLVADFAEGVGTDKDGKVKSGAEKILDIAISALTGCSEEAAEAGRNVLAGFVRGLEDATLIGQIKNAASFAGSLAIGALKLVTKESSPSRVAKGIGEFFSKGFAIGIDSKADEAYKSGYNLGYASEKGAQDGTKKALKEGGGASGSYGRAMLPTGALRTAVRRETAANNKADTETQRKKAATEKKTKDTLNSLADYGNKAWGTVKQAAKGNLDDVDKYVQKTGASLSSLAQSAKESGLSWDGFVGSFKKDGVTGALEYGKNALNNMTGSLTDSGEAASSAAGGYSKAGRAAGGSAGGIGKATDAAKKHADVMEFGKGAIEAYKKMYGETLLVLSDTSPTDAAKKAIMALAEATYNASLKAKESSGVAKEASEDAKEEIDKIAEAYTKLRDSIANTLENQMDMFKKFEYDGEKVTGTEILENMQSNVDAAKRFEVDMKRMAEKGFAQPLMEKVAELGPKGIKQIEAFLKMSEEQVERANQLYGQIVELPYQVTDKTLASWAYAGQMAIQGFADGVGNSSEVASNKVFDVATQTLSTLETTLDEHSPSRKTFAMGENFSLGFIEGIASKADAIINAVADLGKRTLDNMGIFNDKSVSIKLGEDICLGLAEGIKSKTNDVIRAAKEMADAVLEATTDVLEINSPSRAFEEIGRYTDLGFANGISLYSGTVGKAAEALGAGAIDHIKSAVEFISALINEGIDDAPTITPVLDLTNLQEGAGAIDGLLNGTSVAAAGSIQIQNDRNSLVSAMKDAFSSVMTSETPAGDITIHVYGAAGQDPRAIAEAVEERLLVKFNRLRAARA